MDGFGDYVYIALLLIAGVFLGMGPVLLPLLISPRVDEKKTRETYECGIDTEGTAWVRFGLAFYLFALIFVAFEVDVLYLFPVMLVFGTPEYEWRDLVQFTIFLGVLSLALVYAWHRGVFHWRGHTVITPRED